jgi:hypothetical protein
MQQLTIAAVRLMKRYSRAPYRIVYMPMWAIVSVYVLTLGAVGAVIMLLCFKTTVFTL